MLHAKPSVTQLVRTRAHIRLYLLSIHVACGDGIAHLPCVRSSPLLLVINSSVCVCKMVRGLSREERRVERLLIGVSTSRFGSQSSLTASDHVGKGSASSDVAMIAAKMHR